jgi:adenylate kinase
LQIIISGTPGTGKTFVAKKLVSKLKFKYVSISGIVKKYKLSEKYDRKLKTRIVDVEKLSKVCIDFINKSKNNLIIDGHLSYYIPSKYVDLCIITKCDLRVLDKRLVKKGYSKLKIRENLDAEIFDMCLIDALENKHQVLVVDTTKGFNLNKLVKQVRERLK